jgi:hypothetical protein
MLTTIKKAVEIAKTKANGTMFMVFDGDPNYPSKYTQNLEDFEEFCYRYDSHTETEIETHEDAHSFDVFIVTVI